MNDPMDPKFQELRTRTFVAVARERRIAEQCKDAPPEQLQRLLFKHKAAFEAAKAALRDYWRAVRGEHAPFPMDAEEWRQPVAPTVPSEERKIVVA